MPSTYHSPREQSVPPPEQILTPRRTYDGDKIPKPIKKSKHKDILESLRALHHVAFQKSTPSTASRSSQSTIAESSVSTITAGVSIFSRVDGQAVAERTQNHRPEDDRARRAVLRKLQACTKCSTSRIQCKFEHHALEDLMTVATTQEDRDIITWAIETNGEPRQMTGAANHLSVPLDRFAAQNPVSAPHSTVQNVVQNANNAFGDATPAPSLYPQQIAIDDSDIPSAQNQLTRFGNFMSIIQAGLDHLLAGLGFQENFDTLPPPNNSLPLGEVIYCYSEINGRILQRFACDQCATIFPSIDVLRSHFTSTHNPLPIVGVHQRLICRMCFWLYPYRTPQCSNPQCLNPQPQKEQIYCEHVAGSIPDMRQGFVGQDDRDPFRGNANDPNGGYNFGPNFGNPGFGSSLHFQNGHWNSGSSGFLRGAFIEVLKKTVKACKSFVLLPVKLTRHVNRRRLSNIFFAFLAVSTLAIIFQKHDMIIAKLTRLLSSGSKSFDWPALGFGAICFGSGLHRLLVYIHRASDGQSPRCTLGSGNRRDESCRPQQAAEEGLELDQFILAHHL